MSEPEKCSSLVVFVNSEEPNLKLTYASVTLKDLATSIRRSKKWPNKGLRFIVAGRELYEDDIVAAAQTPVLHCMVTDRPVQSREHRPLANTDAVDWMDALDPGKFIMWLMAAVLASCWLLLLIKSDLFDRPSVIMLCVMTATYSAPLLWGRLAAAAALLWPACPATDPSDPVMQEQTG